MSKGCICVVILVSICITGIVVLGMPTLVLGLAYLFPDYSECGTIEAKTCPPLDSLLEKYTEKFDKFLGNSCNATVLPTPTNISMTPIPTHTLYASGGTVRNYFGEGGQLCIDRVEVYCKLPAEFNHTDPNAPLDWPAKDETIRDPSCDVNQTSNGIAFLVFMGLILLWCCGFLLVCLGIACTVGCKRIRRNRRNRIPSYDPVGHLPIVTVRPMIYRPPSDYIINHEYGGQHSFAVALSNSNPYVDDQFCSGFSRPSLPKELMDWESSCARNWNELVQKMQKQDPMATQDTLKERLAQGESSRLVCPISTVVPNVPVMLGGHLFELNDIAIALQSNPNNPITRKPVRIDQIQPYIDFFDIAYDQLVKM